MGLLRCFWRIGGIRVSGSAWPIFLSQPAEGRAAPSSIGTALSGLVIGWIAAFLGVGGSVMTVPLMRRRGIAMGHATAMANPLSLPVALAGTATMPRCLRDRPHPSGPGIWDTSTCVPRPSSWSAPGSAFEWPHHGSDGSQIRRTRGSTLHCSSLCSSPWWRAEQGWACEGYAQVSRSRPY
ncbi:TSUP family transporter [Variovorax sp. Varisp62]|uniref:TSUP family transporter n=1 Tax=Variovorax sp. Varisp62 TaxID=3243049 RepID=UPI0039B3EBBF